MKGFFSNYYFTGSRTTTCTSLRVLLVCRSRHAREKAFENSAAERCGFSSGQCLFFSQGAASPRWLYTMAWRMMSSLCHPIQLQGI
ncbi:hypothetical protein CY35_07G099900 [Sphagnum magellanicum]|uniref:Uncharacterized protein n=1 Tax=Sphagnum magellanicum TaxID=128215 RepID=A0ACB8HPQ6_9BRYO|nr:hypothetical protein CY35_07G099900 [Sphagnum magellanicum]